jgi:hypothetical protein
MESRISGNGNNWVWFAVVVAAVLGSVLLEWPVDLEVSSRAVIPWLHGVVSSYNCILVWQGKAGTLVRLYNMMWRWVGCRFLTR